MNAQTGEQRSTPAEVTRLWLAMGHLYDVLVHEKSHGDYGKVKTEARQRIRQLAGLHGVDTAIRGRILRVLEVAERDPSAAPKLPDELASAVCLCQQLLPASGHGPGKASA